MSALTSSSVRRHGAEPQVLLDGQVGERAPALGHVGDAALATASGRSPMSEARRTRSTPWPRSSPQMARSVVVLPAPLAPSTTTTSTLVDREVDAVQHLHRPVAAGDALASRAGSRACARAGRGHAGAPR